MEKGISSKMIALIAIVCVIDVNNLRRNLFLATQVAELGIPMVLALNQIDVARRDGLSVNTDLLRERLGVPVIAVSARRGEGRLSARRNMHSAMRSCPAWLGCMPSSDRKSSMSGFIRNSVRQSKRGNPFDSAAFVTALL